MIDVCFGSSAKGALKLARHVGKGKDGPSAIGAMGKIKAIPHALTSEREVKALFSARVKELGLVWNKEARQYERRD